MQPRIWHETRSNRLIRLSTYESGLESHGLLALVICEEVTGELRVNGGFVGS